MTTAIAITVRPTKNIVDVHVADLEGNPLPEYMTCDKREKDQKLKPVPVRGGETLSLNLQEGQQIVVRERTFKLPGQV